MKLIKTLILLIFMSALTFITQTASGAVMAMPSSPAITTNIINNGSVDAMLIYFNLELQSDSPDTFIDITSANFYNQNGGAVGSFYRNGIEVSESEIDLMIFQIAYDNNPPLMGDTPTIAIIPVGTERTFEFLFYLQPQYDGYYRAELNRLNYTVGGMPENLQFMGSVSSGEVFLRGTDGAPPAVPEPSTWVMMVISLIFVGVFLGRRRRVCLP